MTDHVWAPSSQHGGGGVECLHCPTWKRDRNGIRNFVGYEGSCPRMWGAPKMTMARLLLTEAHRS